MLGQTVGFSPRGLKKMTTDAIVDAIAFLQSREANPIGEHVGCIAEGQIVLSNWQNDHRAAPPPDSVALKC
jgi:hypothetical protein